ncbi:hypothetical protein M0D68_33795 [Paraburkholderia sp. SEWSISQ10-3 4]|jgi:hypothetical protein|uniref:hypothetical protein n=1 Tax=Paraburkholderia TaxID=1822464 RepID=UPI00225640F7|nr:MULTISPECIES: hypothetical protein [Paraburkholderia]MCX4143215.1 hypothetical protein [Paraburkholderia aspalathi]MDN7175889.1 hypothetical protein [Paraburkholderia sp. SEWSISQ10-3 4]MDQ6505530.1 hypothetical protein [Paraburkholderia aspalathi]
MESSNLRKLKSRIVGIPLFSNVGLPIADTSNPRISQWDAWFGPENSRSLAIAIRQQELHDILVPSSGEKEWNASLRLVVEHVKTLIPYDFDEDGWHAPTTAAWSAAWIFSLEQLHDASGILLPADLSAQLVWYERGRWPCALVEESSGANLEDYVIF